MRILAILLVSAAVAYGADEVIRAEKVGRRAMVISCVSGSPEVVGHNGDKIVVACVER